jgi:periplasmic protein TonB
VIERPRPTPPPPPEAAPPVVLDEATPMSIPAPPPAPPAPSVPAPSYGATEDTSYRRLRPPRYPPQALRRREEGEVILRVLVDTDGRPVEIEVEKSSRSRLLDQAAVQAVRQWVFNPGMKDGKQVQSWVLVPIKFSLSDA